MSHQEDTPPAGRPKTAERKLVFAEDVNIPPAHPEGEMYEKISAGREEEESAVLAPDHPLLERFQKALKEHLERQIESLKNEVFELESGAKKKRADREQLGVEAYEAQQMVNKQQQELELSMLELDEVCSAAEEVERKLEEAKSDYVERRANFMEAERCELRLCTEMESMNLLLHQMKKWESEVESELTINQRVFEKTKKDKIKLADEKRQLDMIIYKLMSEIWRLEEEAQTIDMQLRVKEEEREKLLEAIADCNVDVESLSSEVRCLLHSWNSIVVMISQRDKHHNVLKQELEALHEKIASMAAELDQTKKLCQKEMLQNERLTDIKCKIEQDVENCRSLLEAEKKKRSLLEAQLNNTQTIIDQIDADIQKMHGENSCKSYELSLAIKQLEKITQEKIELEETILNNLDERLTNNKAAKHLNKMVQQVKEKNRDLEIQLANLDNTNAKTLMEIEAQKGMNEEIQRCVNEMVKHQNAVEAEIKERTSELEKLLVMAVKKQREIDVLTNKIEVTINKQGGMDVSPEELKIITIERSIVDAKEKIKHLQKFWLRQQGYVVSLCQQRQNQINDINMLKKQMMLLIQKNLKITDEIEAHKQLEEKMNRCINNLQNRLVILNDELCKKRGNKDVLAKENDFIQNEYINKLKDAKMESLKVEADIVDVEEDKVNLSNQLIELNRVALTWEKKIQMAVETKKSMDEEKGEGGEIGNMKAEIHRMSVRYGQLKKAQDKLIHDLENCISRRDAIITLAEAREKRDKKGSEKTRINFSRKLDDMRNKVTQLENEVETIEKKMESLEEEEKRVIRDIADIQGDIEQTKSTTENRRAKVEEAKTMKQRNLEVLVIKQKKLKMYSELAKNRYPCIAYRTENAIKEEYEKQKITNSKLLNVMENLLIDFPNNLQVLTRIYNTLELPHIYLPITKNM